MENYLDKMEAWKSNHREKNIVRCQVYWAQHELYIYLGLQMVVCPTENYHIYKMLYFKKYFFLSFILFLYFYVHIPTCSKLASWRMHRDQWTSLVRMSMAWNRSARNPKAYIHIEENQSRRNCSPSAFFFLKKHKLMGNPKNQVWKLMSRLGSSKFFSCVTGTLGEIAPQ